MQTILLLLVFLGISPLVAEAQERIFVSVKGSDRNKGSEAKPLRSIACALDKAAGGNVKQVEIILRGGRYDQSQTLEINHPAWKDGSLTIRPYEGEQVSVAGGISLPVKEARKVTDKEIMSRLSVTHREYIRELDLKRLGIPVADLRPSGFSRPSTPSWTEVFVDGKPLKLSRWPNDSVLQIGKVHSTGDIPATNKYGQGNAVFEYVKTERPGQWEKAKNMWIGGYFAHGYADDMIRVAEIDTARRTVTTAEPTHYGFMTGAAWRTWFALNLPEEIDLPGEYALDAKKGVIYFYPPAGRMKSMEVSVLETPLLVIENTANVTVRDITFECSRGMGVYMEGTENVLLSGCTFRNLGNVAVCIGRGDMPDEERNVLMSAEVGGKNTSRVIGSLQGRLYSDILYDRNGGRNNGVKDCHIYQVGAGGVNMGGGNRKTLTPAGNYVENCRIHDFNRIERSYRSAINMDGVGNRISNCELFDAPSMAILFHGNDHLIEYCDIHDVCSEVDDQGAIYFGRDPSERGHVVRYCYFHQFDARHRVTATYHDDGACDMSVYGNIYYKSGSMPVLIGGGHDNHYTNNIFIETPLAIHLDNRMQGWGRGMVAPDGIIAKRLKEVNHTEPPYSTAYPALVNYWNEKPDYPKRNTFSGNLFYKVKNVLSGQSQWGEFRNNWTTGEDPGFVDAANPLKGFKPDAAIFQKIEGFPNLPFDKIGCTLPRDEKP